MSENARKWWRVSLEALITILLALAGAAGVATRTWYGAEQQIQNNTKDLAIHERRITSVEDKVQALHDSDGRQEQQTAVLIEQLKAINARLDSIDKRAERIENLQMRGREGRP